MILALRTEALGESNEPILNHLSLLKCDLPHTSGGERQPGAAFFQCSTPIAFRTGVARSELRKIGFLPRQCLKLRIISESWSTF